MSESILNENLIATFEQSLRQTRNAQNRLMVRLREVETEGDRLRQEIEALDSSAEKTEAAIYSILATMGSKRKPNNGGRGNDDNRNEGGRNEGGRGDVGRVDNVRNNTFNLPSDVWREDQYNSTRDEYRPPNRQDNYSSNGNFRDDSPSAFSNDRNGLYRKNEDSGNYRNDRNNGNNRNNGSTGNHNYKNQNGRYNRNVPQVGHNIEPINRRFSDRTITQACTLLLNESRNPLHVNELYNHLVAGGFKFKGNNPTISIAVSLNRNRRFKKVAPGTFDLVMRDASQAAS